MSNERSLKKKEKTDYAANRRVRKMVNDHLGINGCTRH